RRAGQERLVELERGAAGVAVRAEGDVHVAFRELAGDAHLPRRPDERVLVEQHALRPSGRAPGRQDEAAAAGIPPALVDLRSRPGGFLERAVREQYRPVADTLPERGDGVFPALPLEEAGL